MHFAIVLLLLGSFADGPDRLTIGIGQRRGEIRPAIRLNGPSAVPAEAFTASVALRAPTTYADIETAVPGLEVPIAGTLDVRQSIPLAGAMLEMGIGYRYLSEAAPIFGFGGTALDSRRRQHSLVVGMALGLGRYDDAYIRAGGFGGMAYAEDSLAISLGHVPSGHNVSSVRTDAPVLRGFHAHAGASWRRLRAEAAVMRLETNPDMALAIDDQTVASATLRCRLFRRIGLALNAVTSDGKRPFPFLDDSVSASVTIGFR
jgi:hypothetical protein